MCKADVNADDADVHGEAMRAAERAKFMAKRLDAPKWSVYGQTLDLESFAREHPGGELALRLGQGIEDCTRLFESYHIRNSRHIDVLKKWGVDAPREPSKFHADLKKMAMAYERRHGTLKCTWGHAAFLAVSFAAAVLCAYGWAQGSILAMVALPIPAWLVGVNSAHDASHFAFSKRPWVNNVMVWSFTPLFCLPKCWYGQHVVSHHMHTNEEGKDLDLHHFHGTKVHPRGEGAMAGGRLALWKLSLQAHWLGATFAMMYVYPYQHMIASLLGVDIDKTGDERRVAHFSHMRHWSLKAIYEPLPLMVLPIYAFCYLERPVMFLAVPYMLSGFIFMLFTQISHIQEENQSASVEQEEDWVKQQAMTSTDYSTDSNLWRLASGGLNTQAIHHCMPCICSCHFTALYPEFQAICRKHGVEAPTTPSLFTAIRNHWSYLDELNNADTAEDKKRA